MKYWLGVVSKEHVFRGVKEGFAQVCHGKKAPLMRIHSGDWLIYYSPGFKMGKSDIKSFTAIGKVIDDQVFQFQISSDFVPYRRHISYLPCKDLAIDEVKSELELCRGPSWGFKLRRGIVELSRSDFEKIKRKMSR